MKSLFKIELEAPDPTIYDDTAGSSLIATINKAIPGGMLFSSTSPQFSVSTYFSAGAPNTSVNNDSRMPALPVIVIPGQTSDPVITNRTTSDVFAMTGYSVPAGSVTQIDMQHHTIRLGSMTELVDGRLPDGVGSNVFAYTTLTSEFWALAPGMNEISYDSSSGSDSASAVMYWRPGLRGI